MLFIPPEIQSVIDRFEQNGFEAYLVGGCVRDMLLGNPPHDYDITTSAPPETTAALFQKTVPTGLKHGTVTVLSGGYTVEVTTYRSDGAYSGHRRPESVTFVKSLKEDLARRDFTVNAIAYNSTDGLQDYFGGKEDIENKILRAVGQPEKRFREDALRILRLFRFSSVLCFEMQAQTLNAALKCAPLLKSISAERIAVELKKAVNGKNPAALKPLTDAGALEFIGIRKPDYEKLPHFRESGLSLFAFLYSATSDVMAALEFLKPSNSEKNFFRRLLTLLTLPFPKSKVEIKEMLFMTDRQTVEKYLLFEKYFFGESTEPALRQLYEICENNEPYRISDLKIGGKELTALDINGEKIGETLEKLRRLVTADPSLNKTELLTEKALEFNRN